MKRLAVEIVVGLFVLFAVATARQFSIGADAMRESDAAMSRGEVLGALEHARLAAEARAIGSPYPERAYQRLLEIARGGDTTASVRAWRAIRSASLATRVFGRSGDDERLRVADNELLRITTAPNAKTPAPALPLEERPESGAYVALFAGSLLLYAVLVLLVRLRAPGPV